MNYKTHPCITKLEKPVLTADMSVPGTALTFNAGVAKWKDRYVMMFRNDYGDAPNQIIRPAVTDLRVAFSDDGINWVPQPEPVLEELKSNEIIRTYDPRITVMGDEAIICFAVDTHHGVRGGIAKTTDFVNFEVMSLSTPDNRNLAMFPEKINGYYTRLERPMPVDGRSWLTSGFDIWISQSPDLKFWGNSQLVLTREEVEFSNCKIGPAAPPIKTKDGWLTLFHSVEHVPGFGKHGWEDTWEYVYYAGIMLLDLDDPTKIIGRYDKPLIVPENYWEAEEGFRQYVIFPGGFIAEPDGTAKIYYGAADSVECVATAKLQDLIDLCK